MVNSEGRYFLYRHIRLDKNIPFYIGIGTIYKDWHKTKSFKVVFNRAYSLDRNDIWNNIVLKNNNKYKVEIIECNDDYEYIKEKEKFFINLYGRKKEGGILSNLTVGGDGSLGYRHTEKSKLKMSKSHLGKKLKKETIEKIRQANKGKNISDTHKKILSDLKIGGKNSQSKKIIDVKTKNTFSSIKEAADHLGINHDTMMSYMSGKRPNKTTFLKIDLYNSLKDTPDLYNHILVSSSVKKMVINPSSGEILESINELSSKLNESSASLCLKLNGKNKNNTNYVFLDFYKKHGKEESIKNCNQNINKGKKCVDKSTGIIYESYSSAAKSCGISVLSFSRKMRGVIKNDTNFKPI